MNLFFWRKNRIIDSFAHGLADEFYSRLSPEQLDRLMDQSASKPDKKHDQHLNRLDQLIGQTVNQINSFRQVQNLGIYGKARIHLSFTQRLQELGYSSDSTQKLNRIILLKTP